MVLPRLTVLNEQYAVRNVLGGVGPVDVTYLAWDLRNEEQVVVREYYPSRCVTREAEQLHVQPRSEKDRTYFQYGLERYLKEAAALSRIEHPNVVRERAFFRENGTAYRVTDFHEGATLADVVRHQGGQIAVRTAITLMVPLLDGVRAGHKQGLIHGGITPSQIFLAKNGRPMLLSFRTTHLLLAQRSREFEAYLSPGFASPEQYATGGKQGPWTDVYGCAATLFFILTGQMVPPAPQRLEQDTLADLLATQPRLTPALREAIARGLILDGARRPQTIDAFRDLLMRGAEPSAEPALPEPARAPIPTRIDPLPESDEPAEVTPLFPPRSRAAGSEPGEGDATVARPLFPPRKATVPARPETGNATAFLAPFQPPAPEVDDELTLSVDDDAPTHLELEDNEQAARALSGDGPATPGLLPEHGIAVRKSSMPVLPPAADEPAYAFNEPDLPIAATLEESERPRTWNYTSPRRIWRVAVFGVVGVSVVALLTMFLLRQSRSDASAFMVDNQAYAAKLAAGDSLFKLAQDVEEVASPEQAQTYYNKALEHYRTAQSIRPEDTEALQRIAVVNTRLEVHAARTLSEKDYLGLIASADSILRSADGLARQGDSVRARPLFSDARKLYRRVLEARPDDSLATARLAATFARQLPGRTEAQSLPPAPPIPRPVVSNEFIQNQQFYELYRTQGDSAFDARNYRDAQRKFIEALEYRKDDEYATSMLRQIERRLAETNRESQYRQHLEAGRSLRAEGKLAEAKREFELALGARPDDYEAKSALFEVDLQLNQSQRRDEEYLSFRARGDVLYEQNDFEGALASYQAALASRPDDPYVTNRVRETNANIEALQRLNEQLPEGMIDANGIYNFSEEPPELIGGKQALQARIRYPAFARQAGIEGRVTVRMIVDEAGNMQRSEIMSGLGYGLDEEVLRVLRGARFEPGRVSGKPVKVWHTLFFDFKLDDN